MTGGDGVTIEASASLYRCGKSAPCTERGTQVGILNASFGRLVTREGEHTQQLPLASRACSSYEASFSAARYGLQIAEASLRIAAVDGIVIRTVGDRYRAYQSGAGHSRQRSGDTSR